MALNSREVVFTPRNRDAFKKCSGSTNVHHTKIVQPSWVRSEDHTLVVQLGRILVTPHPFSVAFFGRSAAGERLNS